jgi:hypothetical protein
MSSVVFRTIRGKVVPIKVADGTPGAYPDNRVAPRAGAATGTASGVMPKFTPNNFKGINTRPSSNQIAEWYRTGVSDREIARRLNITNFDDPNGFMTQMPEDVISGFSRRGSVADDLMRVGRESADEARNVVRGTRSKPAGKLGAGLGVAGIALDTYLGIKEGESGRRAFAGAGGAFVGGFAGAQAGAGIGAGIGAVAGSVIPVVGTAAGAAVGATVGSVAGGIAGGFAGGWTVDRIDDRINGPNARTKGWRG